MERLETANRYERAWGKLLSEYLRRAALWARETGGTKRWPLYDIAANADASVTVDPALDEALDTYLGENIGWPGTERACRYAVRFAALRETPGVELPDLPDPFEPLLLLWERGGEVVLDELGGAYFGAAYVGARTWAERVSEKPVVSLDPAVLDGIDTQTS